MASWRITDELGGIHPRLDAYPKGGPMGNRTVSRGFTLIEAAVAIAVVAILSGIIIPLH
jgi:prepilin-type N-terminal cleavage/methylation domain-containing protein